jgi:hypothetical protein
MSTFWGRRGDADMWRPEGGEYREWRDLLPGDLFATYRAVWRVREVRPVPVVDWDEHDREYYGMHARSRSVAEEDWRLRPVYLIVVPADGGKRVHKKIRPYVRRQAFVLHPHYPVCRDCGEPWPCRELEITREVRRQAEEVDRLAAILPGCCWECGEPVTSRQKSVRFDGENLLLPGSPPPVFHLRQKSAGGLHCLASAVGYEEKWVPVAPGRRWRLSCPGNVVRHLDGRECSELADCPDPDGRHHGDVMSHRFTGTADGEIVPVLGSGAEGCRRCLDAVDAGFYAREQAEYLARKNGSIERMTP